MVKRQGWVMLFISCNYSCTFHLLAKILLVKLKNHSHFSMLEAKLLLKKQKPKNVKAVKMVEFIKTCDQYPCYFWYFFQLHNPLLPSFCSGKNIYDKDIYVYYGQITVIITSFYSWNYNTNRSIDRISYYITMFLILLLRDHNGNMLMLFLSHPSHKSVFVKNIHIYIYTACYMYVYIYIYICVYISIYLYLYLCLCIDVYICIYVCIYVCMYIYVYIYLVHLHIILQYITDVKTDTLIYL